MSVRKRTWKTAAGEERQAWIVDYAEQAGKRRMKTFRLKKEADAFETRSRFEITQGTHTPDSASITIAEAADLWIETCAGRRLERSTIDSYRQHIKFHIRPFIGKIKLSQITAPLVRDGGELRSVSWERATPTGPVRTLASTESRIRSRCLANWG